VLVLPNRHSKIFISYRREDSAGHAGRINADLANRFGSKHLFFDINTISPGEDFTDAIQEAVGSCDAMVAIIGKHWLEGSDSHIRMLDNPQDFVRLEISTAIDRKIPIIPVLIQGTRMPRPEDLPKALEAITRRQPLELSDNRWDYDIGQLNVRLHQVIPRQTDWQTIVVIGVCIALMILGTVWLKSKRSHLAPSNNGRESVQRSSRITELYAEPDGKYRIRFGIGTGANPDETSFYELNYVLEEHVCVGFVQRINRTLPVWENVKAQECLDRGLNEAQRSLLNGQITTKAKRLLSVARAERLLSGAKDEYPDKSTIGDDELDTLMANILKAN
jgi:hypothetical protein